ncbi:MAG: IPT/TIG domain-containing protein [Blastocatellia bacterium]|nr:IPT/TIG domain-containing protein [Blastocatellia bacterium]
MNKKLFFISLLLITSFISLASSDFSLTTNTKNFFTSKAAENPFRIKQRNPVVNEGNRIILTTVDNDGNNASEGTTWQSGSPDIAQVNPTTGEVFGIKSGFATITAQRGGATSSVFVAVAKIKKVKGAKVPGDTKLDSQGGVYISNPLQNVILRADDALTAPLELYAGKPRVAGNLNGLTKEALFAGPTAIGIDNNANGGIYIADTLNHSVRRIAFNKQVETILGKGSPGLPMFDANGATSFDDVLLSSPRGVVTDGGGNLYIADTDNHAIYFADFARRKLFLVAGEPGQIGLNDGVGRSAKFHRPSGIALNNNGQILVVADQDNNRVRLIELTRSQEGAFTGVVSTLGVASGSQTSNLSAESTEGFLFDTPQSVSTDGLGNIYVVDKKSVQIVVSGSTEAIQLAQPEVSFQQPISVTIKGSEAFVLDSGANETEALSIVSVAAPEIQSVSPSQINLSEDMEVTITGKNFAPESQVVLGGKAITNVQVISATEIRFRAVAQDIPGKLTLSVLTRGGLAQRPLDITSKPVSMLAVGEITTIAGGQIFTGDGGLAITSNLIAPKGVVSDSNGNLFIFESTSIRRVDKQTSVITTIAGSGSSVEDGVLATTSQLLPFSIVVDKSGNLLVADFLTQSVRKIDSVTNVITTIAGAKGRRFSGDGGPAIQAGFNDLKDLAFDNDGNLLVLEETRLRRIDSMGIITTIAGNGSNKFSGDGGPASVAGFGTAVDVDVDNNSNIFITETTSGRVRQINSSGIINTIAGNGVKNFNKRNGKLATKVGLNSPRSAITTNDGKLFILDGGPLIKLEDGSKKALGAISQVDLNTGIIRNIDIKLSNFPILSNVNLSGILSLDGVGNLFFIGSEFAYRLNLSSGEATPVAGNKKFNLVGDDIAAQFASIGSIRDILVAPNDAVYLADPVNGLVRKIDPNTQIISTILGKDTSNTVDEGDGGLAINAIAVPEALAITSTNKLLIADNRFAVSSRIRQIDLNTGIITTIAGKGGKKDSGDNANALQASISSIFDIAVDSQNNIYIVTSTGSLRKIDAKTNIITSVSSQLAPFTKIAIDKSDNILLAEGKGIIRKLDTKTGNIVVVAGKDSSEMSGDGGLVSQAGLGIVNGLDFDLAGNLFIAVGNNITVSGVLFGVKVRRIDATTNIINTVAGNGEIDIKGDEGLATKAGLGFASKIAVDKKGNFYVVKNIGFFASVRFVKLAN